MIRSGRFLSVLLAAAGAAHLLRPAGFDAIVPRALPGTPRFWTVSSGVVELALAVGLAAPATRRVTGRLTAGFLLAVWPANATMAADAWGARHEGRAGAVRCVGTLLRLPLQVPLVLAALRAGGPPA